MEGENTKALKDALKSYKQNPTSLACIDDAIMIDEGGKKMNEKCATCRFLDADFGLVPCCYQSCVDNNLYEYGGLNSIGLRIIREYIIDNIMRNDDIMNEDARNYVDLPSVIASLYEILHREVTGESYNYMFHWANKCGSYVEDDYFIGGKNKDV